MKFISTIVFTAIFNISGFGQWTTMNTGTTRNLYDIFFFDANKGYIAGMANTLLTTTNGGTNWTQQYSGTAFDNSFTSMSFIGPNTLYLISTNNSEFFLLRSTDQGSTWDTVGGTSFPSDCIHALDFANANTGHVVAEYGHFAKRIEEVVTRN